MLDLTTHYMNMNLKNPLIASASPLTSGADNVKRLEDAGIAAVVMHSIFEEQINHDIHEIDHFLYGQNDSFSEATEFFPMDIEFENAQSEDYLREIEAIKKSVDIPVIGSLNGISNGGWIDFSTKLQQAGVDAIELNISYIPTDADIDSKQIEEMYVSTVADLRKHVEVPLNVKMNRYFSAPANMAKRLETAGANGLTIFDNPSYVDLDTDTLEPVIKAELSSFKDLSETLRWCAILYKQVQVDLCANTGIHGSDDIIKALLSGANATAFTSILLQEGVQKIGKMLAEIEEWMQQHEYKSVAQMIGAVSLQHTSNPAAYERSSYMRALTTYRY
jgi:dihydroorotate dehydrogenase (fumarate)